jgi:hypothetical protein
MKLSRTAAILALLLPVALAAQGAAPQPTAAQLKARAELARQRALQQQAQQTKAPATAPGTAPATKTAGPQTKTATTAQVPTPQTKSAVPQTKTVTPPPVTTKTATIPVPQTKTVTPQTKTAELPPPQTKAPPAGSALAAGQTAAPRLQPTPPAEVTFNREVFAYVKGNRRDPFTTMITSSDLRPQITDLKLVTVIRSANAASSVAIMRDLTTNEQYRVRVGQTLGRMRVAQIQQRAVVFSIEEFGYNRQEVVSMDDSTRARTP